ncbi:MAG: fatty acid desaturase [Phycisphaerales bacterium]|nr:fatty acid desaturase [Phycisphaerales bacterium]
MLVPLAGLVAAMAFAWGWGLGWVELALLVGYVCADGFGVTIGYHRLFTHRSFETGPVLTAIFGVLGSMSVEGPVLRWVAFHRRHHQHSDKPGDPHSPHNHGEGVVATLRGFCSAHMGWMMRTSDADLARYVADLRKSGLVRVVSAVPAVGAPEHAPARADRRACHALVVGGRAGLSLGGWCASCWCTTSRGA